jgi:hypothetical protein
MNHITGELELQGQGQNSLDDTWHASFKGKAIGPELGAIGRVATPEGVSCGSAASS